MDNKTRELTRERVKRYRDKKKGISEAVTLQKRKMVCKCQYFKLCNGQLICSVCGRPPDQSKIEDKIMRGVENKSGG